MTITASTAENTDVKVPETQDERFYILHYHFRNSNPLFLIFKLRGTLPQAIERGQLHCRRCNYKFIKVRPFVVDLAEREKRLNEGSYTGEHEQDI